MKPEIPGLVIRRRPRTELSDVYEQHADGREELLFPALPDTMADNLAVLWRECKRHAEREQNGAEAAVYRALVGHNPLARHEAEALLLAAGEAA